MRSRTEKPPYCHLNRSLRSLRKSRCRTDRDRGQGIGTFPYRKAEAGRAVTVAVIGKPQPIAVPEQRRKADHIGVPPLVRAIEPDCRIDPLPLSAISTPGPS